MGLKAGSYWTATFFTKNPTTGAAQNADTTPTLTWQRNGVPDPNVPPTLTITNPATGQYDVSGIVPTTYAGGDMVQVSAAATVATVTSSQTVSQFILDDDLGGNLAAVAGGPRSASSDGHEVTQQPLPDLIAADQYLAAKQAGNVGGAGPPRRGMGLRWTKLTGPAQVPATVPAPADQSFGSFG